MTEFRNNKRKRNRLADELIRSLPQSTMQEVDQYLREKYESTVGTKRTEYSDHVDALENFRSNALFIAMTYGDRFEPDAGDLIVLYLLKHIQSLAKAVGSEDRNNLNAFWRKPDGSEGLLQRIIDVQVYASLLAGWLVELALAGDIDGDEDLLTTLGIEQGIEEMAGRWKNET